MRKFILKATSKNSIFKAIFKGCLKIAFPAFVTASLTLCSCSKTSEDSIANGTGSNAGEAELAQTFTVTNSKGKPLARGTARIWTMNESSIDIEWSDTLDNNGKFTLSSKFSGQHLLETRSGDTLSVMRWIDFGKNPSQTLAARNSVSLKGTITNAGAAVEGATISILDKTAKTDATGAFAINGLPEGVHYAFVEGSFGKFSYQMQTGLGKNGTTNNIDIADNIFTVIEDFENWGERQTMIGKSFGEGWWFICTDSLQGGGSHSTDLFSNDLLITGEGAKNGSSMHAVFDLDESYDGHYGVTGFSIGGDFFEHETAAFYDLRGTRAISFDAKGDGSIYLQVTKRGADGQKEFHKTYAVTLGEKWEHFTFTAEDFDTELVAVNSINFMVEQDAEIYLDNVRLDGISPSMWPSLGMTFE